MSANVQSASMRNCIQLAACSATQLLPMNPELPADLFTACLTTPIKMALRWFVMQNQGKLAPRITVDMLDKIPGKQNLVDSRNSADRYTALPSVIFTDLLIFFP